MANAVTVPYLKKCENNQILKNRTATDKKDGSKMTLVGLKHHNYCSQNDYEWARNDLETTRTEIMKVRNDCI